MNWDANMIFIIMSFLSESNGGGERLSFSTQESAPPGIEHQEVKRTDGLRTRGHHGSYSVEAPETGGTRDAFVAFVYTNITPMYT